MKIEKDLELRKPIKLIYDGEDFGVYKFNEEKNRYEGIIGYLEIETIIRAIRDKDYFIQVRSIEE